MGILVGQGSIRAEGLVVVSLPDISLGHLQPGLGHALAVWVRFYDANGRRLMEKQMAVGERFEIPSDAEGPQIWTGRPDAFAITIDGRSVPKLAEEESVIRDVAISAEALLARNSNEEDALAN